MFSPCERMDSYANRCTAFFPMDDESDQTLFISAQDKKSQMKNQQQQNFQPQIREEEKVPEKRRRRRRRGRQSHNREFEDYYDYGDEMLGSGSQGVVCRCINKETKIHYAVKLICKSSYHDRSRILKEIDIYRMCRHCPNVIKLHDFLEDDQFYYMVFELMRGGQLLRHIHDRGHLTEAEASQVTKQIAEALRFIHFQGLAHRDLKPENILCEHESQLLPVKVCDFDLASSGTYLSGQWSPGDVKVLSTPVGSAQFMAPEVVEAWIKSEATASNSAPAEMGFLPNFNQHLYDKQCDMWSLGVIIYIMLCGCTPFYARCNEPDCRLDDGQYCEKCQHLLFDCIKEGKVRFAGIEWEFVSYEAKDLIKKLLVTDSQERLTASQVVQHRWIKNGGSSARLSTAKIMKRDKSVERLSSLVGGTLSLSKPFDHFASRKSKEKNEDIDAFVRKFETGLTFRKTNQNPPLTKVSKMHQNTTQDSSSPKAVQDRILPKKPSRPIIDWFEADL